MDICEKIVSSVDWARFHTMQGDATQFSGALLQLIHSRDGYEAEEIWRRGIENVVFAQNGIYDAAEPTIDVMLAALVTDRPAHVKASALELLFHIVNGGSEDEPDLARRCSERVIRGTWLLVREAVNGPEWVPDAVLGIMDILDPVQADSLRSWIDASGEQKLPPAPAHEQVRQRGERRGDGRPGEIVVQHGREGGRDAGDGLGEEPVTAPAN